jgi:hypothetical protein
MTRIPITLVASILPLAFVVLGGCLAEPADLSRSDSFDEATLGDEWYIYDADCSGTVHDRTGSTYDGNTVELVNGQLRLNGNGRDFFGSPKDHVGIWRTDFEGDFDVSVKIVEMTTTASPSQWAKAGIVVANDRHELDSANGLAHFHAFGPQNANYEVGRLMGQTTSPSSFTSHQYTEETNPPSPRFPVWLRLKRSGNMFQGYYKYAEDEGWHAYGTPFTPRGVAEDVEIGIFSVGREDGTCNALSESACPATACNTGYYAVFDDFVDLEPPLP